MIDIHSTVSARMLQGRRVCAEGPLRGKTCRGDFAYIRNGNRAPHHHQTSIKCCSSGCPYNTPLDFWCIPIASIMRDVRVYPLLPALQEHKVKCSLSHSL